MHYMVFAETLLSKMQFQWEVTGVRRKATYTVGRRRWGVLLGGVVLVGAVVVAKVIPTGKEKTLG